MEDPDHTLHHIRPTVSNCLSLAWKQMWKQMSILVAFALLMLFISMPGTSFTWNFNSFPIHSFSFDSFSFDSFFFDSLPPFFFPFVIGSSLYSLLLLQPMNYGYHFSTMKVARGEHIEAADLFEAFKNYGHTILSSVIVGVLTAVGFVFLIVPGVIIACKLAFVPLLVVDRKMTAMEAISTSWNMTDGHAFTIFALLFVSVFIALGGLAFFIVGIIPAAIWIQTAFGAMYVAISE